MRNIGLQHRPVDHDDAINDGMGPACNRSGFATSVLSDSIRLTSSSRRLAFPSSSPPSAAAAAAAECRHRRGGSSSSSAAPGRGRRAGGERPVLPLPQAAGRRVLPLHRCPAVLGRENEKMEGSKAATARHSEALHVVTTETQNFTFCPPAGSFGALMHYCAMAPQTTATVPQPSLAGQVAAAKLPGPVHLIPDTHRATLSSS